MLRTLAVVLLLMGTAAMATPKDRLDKPRLREPSWQEQDDESERGRHFNQLFDKFTKGEITIDDLMVEYRTKWMGKDRANWGSVVEDMQQPAPMRKGPDIPSLRGAPKGLLDK